MTMDWVSFWPMRAERLNDLSLLGERATTEEEEGFWREVLKKMSCWYPSDQCLPK